MCVGRVRVNLKNFPLYVMYSHWRVPTFTQIDQKKTEHARQRLGDEAESKEYQY